MNIAIFGAQSIALGLYQAFHKLYPQKDICCFLVSSRKNNPTQLAGIPVQELSTFASELSQEDKDNLQILIATPENVMKDIEMTLENYGFKNHIRQTSLRWAELMGYYYMCNTPYITLSALPVGCHKSDICMFMAKFYKDKPLIENYHYRSGLHLFRLGLFCVKKE